MCYAMVCYGMMWYVMVCYGVIWQAAEEGFELGKASGSFKANSKALAEGAGEGIAKVIIFLASANLKPSQ